MSYRYGYTKIGYTQSGYTAQDWDKYWSDINLKFWKPRVQIYDYLGTTLLHDYNGFNSSNTLTIEKMSCTEQLGTAGTFEILIRDDSQSVDRTKVGNANKVIISISRNNLTWYRVFSGYVEQVKVMRNKLNGLKYLLNGFGSGIIIQETLINLSKKAISKAFGSADPDTNDPNMKVNVLMNKILTNTDHLISSTTSIQSKGGFDVSLINPNLDLFVPELKVKFDSAANGINSLMERSGGVWGVNAYDQVWAWLPGTVHSGVTLKTFDGDKTNPRISDTSYFFGNWDYQMPIDYNSFANVLVSIAGTKPKPGEQSTGSGDGSTTGTPIGNVDVCQEINVTIPDLSQISVLLKKIGPIVDKFVNGVIYADNGANKPTNQVLMTFQLDISNLIQNVVSSVFSTNVSKIAKQIPIGTKCHLSLNSTGTTDNSQTVMWMNNGNGQVVNGLYSGTRPKNTSGPNSEGAQPFTTNNTTTTYTYATFYETKTKVIVKDDVSIARYGEVERFVNVDWTTDFRTINDLLFLMLNSTAKPPMIFNTEKVSIPTPPFQVGKMVTVEDTISGLGAGKNIQAEINSVGYEFDSYGESGVGTFFCSIGISSLYDYIQVEGLNVSSLQELSCSPPV